MCPLAPSGRMDAGWQPRTTVTMKSTSGTSIRESAASAPMESHCGSPDKGSWSGRPVFPRMDGGSPGGTRNSCPEMPDCPNKQILLQQALALPLNGATLGAPEALTGPGANSFRYASPSSGGWSLADRDRTNQGSATLDILKAGQVVASITRDASNGLNHHAYGFSPDGKTIISGGSYGVMTAYDRKGKTRGAFAGHEGNVFAVAPSPNGRYLVSASADETVRLWNLKTRELIVSLFQGKDGEWVMWTPQGFFASSPACAELIGWQINHGPEHEAEYVTAASSAIAQPAGYCRQGNPARERRRGGEAVARDEHKAQRPTGEARAAFPHRLACC